MAGIMIFWVAMPVLIAAFGNFLIPLMIGCDDMVFPRINRLSYQIFLLSAIVLLSRKICGIGHGLMGARIFIETPEQHASWLAEQGGVSIAALTPQVQE